MWIAMLRLVCLCALTILGACAGTSIEIFPHWSDLDSFEREWYSKHLSAARETTLPEVSRKTIVRLTWLRSFHNPVVVRVECGTSCRFFSKRLSGTGGYEPGTVVESHRGRLGRAHEDEMIRLVSAALDYQEEPVDDKTYVRVDGQLFEEIIVHTDGARWVVEIVNASGYVASSTRGTELRKKEVLWNLCKYLVSISQIEIPDGEYY